MQQIVLPIKDSNVLKEVQDTLLHNFKAGRRNYIFIQNSKGVTYVWVAQTRHDLQNDWMQDWHWYQNPTTMIQGIKMAFYLGKLIAYSVAIIKTRSLSFGSHSSNVS